MTIDDHLKAIGEVEQRNERFLHVTAYENQLSAVAASYLDSKLSERYYFGAGDQGVVNWDPFTCLGLKAVEDLISDAERAACTMMHGTVANLRCLSGVHAMLCSILVATDPGDTVMIVRHEDGGHFSTRPILERTGRKAAYAAYDSEHLRFDAAKTAQAFREAGCKALYLDISYTTTKVNLRELREALGTEAIIIFDASHTIGLMMGGVYQMPLLEGADIVCANTHKTLPGPHKGMIVFKDAKWGGRLNAVINNGLFSSSHTNHLLALAVTILEMEQFGKEYAAKIIENANALGAAFAARGYEVRRTPAGSYTETHQTHVFLPAETPGIDLYRRLVNNDISTNFDNRIGGKLFMRLGAQELTRLGLEADDMEAVADALHRALQGDDVRDDVRRLKQKCLTVRYSFDTPG